MRDQEGGVRAGERSLQTPVGLMPVSGWRDGLQELQTAVQF